MNDGLPSKKGFWERLEIIARIASSIAIPVVLATVGWFVQRSLAESNSRQEYVKVAVSILNGSIDSKEAPLRDWAVQVLNRYSAVKLDSRTQQALTAGQIELPTTLPFAMSSDDQRVGPRVLTTAASLEFPKTSPGQSSTLTITLTGSRPGDVVVLS